MRFIYTIDENGDATLAVPDEWGSGDHGFTDGDPVLYDASAGVNGNATEVPARWFEDVQRAIKYAAREGTGLPGVAANADDDDPYELAAAVGHAADVYAGTASFVSRGLQFTTNPASLTVTLVAGVFSYLGRKYHATADRLAACVVAGDGTGNGNSFTLPASSDCYVSIGPPTDITLAITVLAVGNGDAAPVGDLPAGQFFMGILVTDGTGVVAGGVTYIEHAKVIAGNDDQGLLRLRYNVSDGTALEPYDFVSGATLGSRSSFDASEAVGGNFWTNLYTEEVEIRSYTGTAYRDRTRTFSRDANTVGAVSDTMNVLDLDDYTNGSTVEIQVSVVGYSTTNSHVYTRSFAQMARRNNAGTMGLVGALVETRTELDSGVLGLASTLIASAEPDSSFIQVQVTGAAANTIEWTARITTIEKWGAP